MRLAPVVAFFLFAFATPASADLPPPPGNVIFVTMDGVRFQEFFGGVQMPERAGKPRGTALFPRLHEDVAAGEAWIFGGGGEGGSFQVGNEVAMSLPGYLGILSGEFETKCRNNHCENIDHDTIFDGLADLGFGSEDLAAFTSWEGLGRALEHRPGRINRDVAHGGYPTVGVSAAERMEADRIAKADREDIPHWGARRDRYTYALGRLYLELHRPRFLFLSFLDSDEYAHEDAYRNYVDSLQVYDAWISELRAGLAAMGEYGENTSIVLTTDHGRGRGPFWQTHGKFLPSSFQTWAAVIPSARLRASGAICPRRAKKYTQLDFRPTLESLLGLTPTHDPLHPGLPIVERKASTQSRTLASQD